jgi:hypothetical protein
MSKGFYVEMKRDKTRGGRGRWLWVSEENSGLSPTEQNGSSPVKKCK